MALLDGRDGEGVVLLPIIRALELREMGVRAITIGDLAGVSMVSSIATAPVGPSTFLCPATEAIGDGTASSWFAEVAA